MPRCYAAGGGSVEQRADGEHARVEGRAKSWSVSVSMRRQMPSASEKSTSATASGSARRCSAPSACLRASSSATCSRVRRSSSANSLAISSLRRERVKSSKTTVMNSGSSST